MTAIALPAAPDRYRFKYLIAITVSLASVLELLDTSIVNVAIPHMMGNLGATLDQIAWVSTGYIVANVIVLPITGWLSAYFGRRSYFAGSIALFTIASFMCGNAGSLGSLVFWRIIQGLGGGALLSTSQAILYEEFPREEYGTAMAIFGVGVMVGPTLGPTVGGWITDMYGWPWIFYINIPFGMLALALTLSFINDSLHQERSARVDFVGLGLLAVGIGALQTMLERGERLDWFASGSVRLLAITSAISLITFVWHELRTEHPVVDLRILKSRQLAVGVVFGLVLGVCLYATVFVLPVYLQNVRNFTANQTGLVILPGALASAFTMASMGRLTGKFDGRLSIAAGVGIFALSMWKHAHFTTDSGMSDFFWPLIFRGVGLGLIFVPLTNLALADLPMSRIPNGTGLFNLMRQLGGSVGIAMSATLLQRFTAIHRADLAANVTPYAEATRERLTMITQSLISRGELPALAQTKAIGFLNGVVTKQWTLLNVYVGAHLLSPAPLAGLPRVLAWGAVLLVAWLPLVAMFTARRRSIRSLDWAAYTAMGLSSLLIVSFSVIDLLRLPDTARVVLAVVSGAALLTLLGIVLARRPRVVRVTVPIADLPSDLAGFRILQLSDLHIGPTIRRPFVDAVVDRANALRPDLVAVTGDVADGLVPELREHVAPLGRLHAPHGAYFVTGNHEYYWDVRGWTRELERLGIAVLSNEHRLVVRGEGRLLLAGVTDLSAASDPAAAVAGAPPSDVRVLLAHQPRSAFAAQAAGYDLQLSGHTHGGQYFPFNLLIRLFQPFVAGLHRLESMWLYVSRGTGYWGPPLRLCAPAEITLLELVPA